MSRMDLLASKVDERESHGGACDRNEDSFGRSHRAEGLKGYEPAAGSIGQVGKLGLFTEKLCELRLHDDRLARAKLKAKSKKVATPSKKVRAVFIDYGSCR